MSTNNYPVPKLKHRDPESHKGTFGRALIIAGSRGMSGAAVLSGTSCVKSGAGLVSIALPDCSLETVAAAYPCFMTIPLPNDNEGRIAAGAQSKLLELSEQSTSIGIGPGLSRSDALDDLVSELFKRYRGPMVVDADALNALAARHTAERQNQPAQLPEAAGSRILTPHIGEFRRLVSDPKLSADACRPRAHDFARENRVIVVLKGHQTLVTDGTQSYANQTGNPGMATGGSGDVLTGLITALLGQDYTPFEATVLGVHLHGLAGDLASEQHGQISLDALSVVDFLPAAFCQLTQDQTA